MILLFGLLPFIVAIHGLYPGTSDVVDLTEHNFDELVTRSDAIWVVEFYAPWCGHCKQFVSTYSKAATALKGVVKVGGVNADEHKSLSGRFGIKGFPTVKIFGHNKYKPDEFSGDRALQSLVEAALKAVKAKVYHQLGVKPSDDAKAGEDNVVELTDSNFDSTVLKSEEMWMVEFFAPWCGHCKNLAPQWAQAANELKGKVKLGALDATVHTGKTAFYEIKGYPTIKFFLPGKKDFKSAKDYIGGRTASDIVNWALEQLSDSIPAPEIKQVVDENTITAACENQPLCVIAVLPHILDCQTDCRNGYLETLKKMGEKYKKKMWGWVWSEAGVQPELESALEIGGFGYPAMAVLSAKKMKYSMLRGAFSNDGINEFLRELSFGRGRTISMRGATLPKVENLEPWDGKDAELPQDEDIDLSDVDLDDLSKDEL